MKYSEVIFVDVLIIFRVSMEIGICFVWNEVVKGDVIRRCVGSRILKGSMGDFVKKGYGVRLF